MHPITKEEIDEKMTDLWKEVRKNGCKAIRHPDGKYRPGSLQEGSIGWGESPKSICIVIKGGRNMPTAITIDRKENGRWIMRFQEWDENIPSEFKSGDFVSTAGFIMTQRLVNNQSFECGERSIRPFNRC